MSEDVSVEKVLELGFGGLQPFSAPGRDWQP